MLEARLFKLHHTLRNINLSEQMSRIAVIGAGAIGLSCAVNIQKLVPNAQVTIIADKFVNDTTSNGAGGYFRPNIEDFHVEDRLMVSQWLRNSWEFYNGLAQSEKADESGQTLVSGTVVYNTPKDGAYSLLAELAYDFHQIKEVDLKKMKLNYKYGYSFTTIITQSPKYFMWLTRKFQEAGGSILKRKVQSLQELSEEFDFVVNCCGLGAQELVNDKNIYPVKGHLVMVQAPWVKNFFLSEDDIYLIPHNDKLIIGGTREKGNYDLTPDLATRDRILKRAETLFPQLKGAKLLGDWVGLRPACQRIRFETEILDCGSKGKLPVLHNYGHGGHGISLSWGSGVDAANVVKNMSTAAKSRL